MKVLYLVTGIRPPLASGSQFIQKLFFKISKMGVDATIISPIYIHTEKNMGKWATEQEKKYNVKFVLIDTPPFIKKIFLLHIAITPFLTTIAILKVLSQEKFDIVHEFTSTPAITIRSLLYRIFNVPSVFTLSVLNKTIFGKFFWFKIFDFGSAYLIPSREIINKLIKLGINKQKIFYLLPSIDTENFKRKNVKSHAREILGLPKNLIIMTYYGALSEEKGVFDLLDAEKLLPSEIKEKIHIAFFCYYLKGFETFEKMVKKIKSEIPKNVKLYVKFADIPQVIAASDFIIYPQRTGHGTTIPPMSILETLASQKPVIATDIVGIREVVTSQNGILVPPSNPVALSEAIRKAALGDLKFNLKENFQDFDSNNVTTKLLFIYEKLKSK